ncbi:hypothetical protein LZ32DRAFT_189520 [Colletotrichum eremochloae]|nr:hypothetical protein LZ32DRAFT_189520 [Colletotrichum eremochloae]
MAGQMSLAKTQSATSSGRCSVPAANNDSCTSLPDGRVTLPQGPGRKSARNVSTRIDVHGTSPSPFESRESYLRTLWRHAAPWVTRIDAAAATFGGGTWLLGLMCALRAVAARNHARMWFSLAFQTQRSN